MTSTVRVHIPPLPNQVSANIPYSSTFMTVPYSTASVNAPYSTINDKPY